MEKFVLFVLLTLVLGLTACGNNATIDTDEEVVGYATAEFFSDELESVHAAINALRIKWNEDEKMHAQQYQLLREFAVKKNTGTIYLDDLIITLIRYTPTSYSRLLGFDENHRPKLRPVFNVSFLDSPSLDIEELTKALLNFTGIDEENIEIRMVDRVQLPLRERFDDFLLVNEEYYRLMQPYLRLREFATIINSDTYYYDEVVIAGIIDRLWSFSYYTPISRFGVWFLNEQYTKNTQLISEILEFTGLASDEISFTYMAFFHDFTQEDFLQVNAELGELTRQAQLLEEYQLIHTAVRSTRRGLFMHMPIRNVRNATIWMYEGWQPFRVTLDRAYYPPSEGFIEDLLNFTGIDRNNIEFEVYDLRDLVNRLEPEDLAILMALETYKVYVNAPFWENPHQNHPVIYEITLPRFYGCDKFAIHLYDIDLLIFLYYDQEITYFEAIIAGMEAMGIPGDRVTFAVEVAHRTILYGLPYYI